MAGGRGLIWPMGEVLIRAGRAASVRLQRLSQTCNESSSDKLAVVIESHPDSEYGLMVEILDELRLADARRISLKEMKVAKR